MNTNGADKIQKLIALRDKTGADVQAEIDALFEALTGTTTSDPFGGADYSAAMARLG